MAKLSVPEIRKQAEDLLARFQIARPAVPVEKLAQHLCAQIKYAPYDGELAGMLIRSEGEAIIAINSLHHPNRQRFTIAHELGHLFLHPREEVHVDRVIFVNKRDSTSSKATDLKEIEANRFAAELLMPYRFILEDLDRVDIENEEEIQRLAQKYNVSMQAMITRISSILSWHQAF